MATTKKRINISLPDDVEKALIQISDRDQVPQATKAVYLLKIAIEIDEDDVWNRIAEKRDIPTTKFISHKNAWK